MEWVLPIESLGVALFELESVKVQVENVANKKGEQSIEIKSVPIVTWKLLRESQACPKILREYLTRMIPRNTRAQTTKRANEAIPGSAGYAKKARSEMVDVQSSGKRKNTRNITF